MIRGYLHGRGDAETEVRVGERIRHRTGDAGIFDDTGRLWLAGRISGRVRLAEGWLYPFPAENVALSCPGVRRAALVEAAGRAWIALEAGLEARGVSQAFADRGWNGVRVCRVASIPVDRRHNAKVDFTRLRRIVSRRCVWGT